MFENFANVMAELKFLLILNFATHWQNFHSPPTRKCVAGLNQTLKGAIQGLSCSDARAWSEFHPRSEVRFLGAQGHPRLRCDIYSHEDCGDGGSSTEWRSSLWVLDGSVCLAPAEWKTENKFEEQGPCLYFSPIFKPTEWSLESRTLM